MTAKVVNYSEAQVASMSADFLAGKSVETLATEMGKSVRSVVAKLAQLGLYKAQSAKEAKARVTKADLVAAIAAKVGVDKAALASFEKADKAALEALVGKL